MAENIRRRGYVWGSVALLWLTLISRVSLSVNPNALDNIDAAGFDRLAVNLLTGHGFTMDSVCPESVRTPLYPVFLAGIYGVFGHNLQLAFLIQGLLDLVAAAVVFRLSAALWPRRRFLAGMLPLGCYLIALSQWRFDNELLSEGLLTPLLALAVFGFWLSARDRQSLSRRLLPALLAGICLGLVILCKPNYELAPLVFLAGYALLHSATSATARPSAIFSCRIPMTITLPGYPPWRRLPRSTTKPYSPGRIAGKPSTGRLSARRLPNTTGTIPRPSPVRFKMSVAGMSRQWR